MPALLSLIIPINMKHIHFLNPYVNHQYSVPLFIRGLAVPGFLKKSFDFLFFNFRQHAEGAQHPCHPHNDEHSHIGSVAYFLPSMSFLQM